MKNKTIAFVGAGNMSKALISGLIGNGYSTNHIWASNPSSAKLNLLSEKWNIHTTTSNQEAVEEAGIVILAIKPSFFPQVCAEIRPILEKNKPLIISVAAGVTIEAMEQWLGGSFDIVRAMPNIAATVNASATGLYVNSSVSLAQKDTAEIIFRSVGTTVWLEKESDLVVVCALAGSGPAYFFYIMEFMEEIAVKRGLKPEIAKLLTEETLLGAAKMSLESGQSPKILRHAVTSPKGTTQAAIQIFDENHLDQIIEKAIIAAIDRHQEIIKDFII